MRKFVLLMSACAFAAAAHAQTPPAAPAAPAAAPAPTPAVTAPAASAAPAAAPEISRELARELKQYSKTIRKGETLYCKADAETGTRVPKKQCYTLDAVRQMLAESQRARDDMQKPASFLCDGAGCN